MFVARADLVKAFAQGGATTDMRGWRRRSASQVNGGLAVSNAEFELCVTFIGLQADKSAKSTPVSPT